MQSFRCIFWGGYSVSSLSSVLRYKVVAVNYGSFGVAQEDARQITRAQIVEFHRLSKGVLPDLNTTNMQELPLKFERYKNQMTALFTSSGFDLPEQLSDVFRHSFDRAKESLDYYMELYHSVQSGGDDAKYQDMGGALIEAVISFQELVMALYDSFFSEVFDGLPSMSPIKEGPVISGSSEIEKETAKLSAYSGRLRESLEENKQLRTAFQKGEKCLKSVNVLKEQKLYEPWFGRQGRVTSGFLLYTLQPLEESTPIMSLFETNSDPVFRPVAVSTPNNRVEEYDGQEYMELCEKSRKRRRQSEQYQGEVLVRKGNGFFSSCWPKKRPVCMGKEDELKENLLWSGFGTSSKTPIEERRRWAKFSVKKPKWNTPGKWAQHKAHRPSAWNGFLFRNNSGSYFTEEETDLVRDFREEDAENLEIWGLPPQVGLAWDDSGDYPTSLSTVESPV